jgi:hypothetical protein
MSELNVDDEINKTLTVKQEKPKTNTQPKYKLILKERSKSRRKKIKK